jgi:uroporphyrinogen decarboxylase
MTSKERVLCALNHGQPDRVPFAEHQIDQPVPTVLFGAQLAADPVYVAEQLGLDVLTFTLLPPLYVEETKLPDGRTYQTGGRLHTRKDLDILESLKDPTDPALYTELETLIRRNDGRRAIIGKTRLGLSAMLMSMDLEGFSLALADDPDLVIHILKRYVQWSAVAIHEMCQRGVDLIWCFDDFAHHSGPMMSPGVFREVILPCLMKTARSIPVPWIFHSDGDVRLMLKDLLTLRMNGLHPLEPECLSLKELKRQIGHRVCLVGNVSVDILSRGTTAQTRQEVQRCLRDGSPSGGYMITSSNSIPSYAIPENVLAMADEIRKAGIK